MKLKKSIMRLLAAKVAIFNSSIKIIVLSLKFFTAAVLVRYCSSDIVGTYNYYVFFIFFAVYLLGFEVYNYSLKNILKAENLESRRAVSNYQLSFSLLSVTASIPLFFLYFYFVAGGVDYFPVVVLGAYGEILFLDIYRIFNITNKQLISNFLMLARTTFSSVCVFFLIWLKLATAFNLLLFFFGSGFLFSAASLFLLKYKFVMIPPSMIIKDIFSARDMYFAAAILRGQQFFDKHLIFITLGATSVASYTFFLMGINASLTILESGIFVFALQNLHGNECFYKESKNLRIYVTKLFFRILLFSALLVMLISFFLIGFSHLNGNISYIHNLYMLFPLCLASIFLAISYPFHLVLYFTNRERMIFKSNLLSGIGFFLSGIIFTLEKSPLSLSLFIVSYPLLQLITKFTYAKREL